MRKRSYSLFTLLAFALSLLAITPAVAQTTIEEKMAFIDGNYPHKVKLARYEYLVRTLSARTGTNREQIGDMTANAKEILARDYGKEIKLIELLEGVNRFIPAGARWSYAKAITRYVILIGQ